MTFTTVLTLGGIGLTVALLETVLESMEKPMYATLLKVLTLGAFSFVALNMFAELIKEMGVFLKQWGWE